MSTDPLFLTGATGFVGMELMARYLERTEREIFALVRARDDDEADARLRAAIATMLPDASLYADRIVAVRGDVAEPGLGMTDRRRRAVAAEVGEVVHSAASVSFALPLAESRAINVEGTRRMLEFAELCARHGGLRRMSHVSTAYVAGDHRGRFGEDDLGLGQGFRNPYEQSKFESERLVRARMGDLPIQVFRPSIVVGEHTTGWTPTFNVIYWPLRAFAMGLFSAIPARRSSPVDIVPVDYVADAIFELSRRPNGAGGTYNLAAGPVATTVGELLELSASYFDRQPPTVVPPEVYDGPAPDGSEIFFPYFAMRVAYDTTRARARLAGTGIEPPPLRDYFTRLLDYAVAAGWGRRRADRPSAAQAPALGLRGAAARA